MRKHANNAMVHSPLARFAPAVYDPGQLTRGNERNINPAHIQNIGISRQ
jgi:hypothetical protein